MTAARAVEVAPRPDPLAVFTARCEARALLWRCLEFDLHEAVDALQAAAIASGLVAEIGQDEVQRLMATAFHAVRGDLPKSADMVPDDIAVAPAPRRGAAASTLMAAEYLVRENDPEQLQRWLAQHGAEERTAILQHLEKRQRTQAR
jgi:hypothetical protein